MDKIDRLLDAMEHPELCTQAEIEALLQDPEVKEVLELLDKTKSSLQPIVIPDIEDEWKAFERNHRGSEVSRRFRMAGMLSRKAAASIAIGIVSFTAVAAIVGIGINQLSGRQEVCRLQEVKTGHREAIHRPDSIKSVVNDKVSNPEIVVFDNEPLETMVTRIADHYGYKVMFNDDASKSLRLYFRWNQAHTIEEVAERLNNFEQINIVIKDNTIEID